MGAIPHAKATEAKLCKAFQQVKDVDTRQELLECDCGYGVQDSVHFWKECAFSEGVRQDLEATAAPDVRVILHGSPQDQGVWDVMTEEQKMVHAVSAKLKMSPGLERRLRESVVPIWVEGAQKVAGVYRSVNVGWKDWAERFATAEQCGFVVT